MSLENKELICICCPRGCHLSVSPNLDVTGNICPRGAVYAKQEISNPLRTLTSTMRISGASLPLCPVKTKDPIPKGKLFEAMHTIDCIHLEAPIKIGDVVIPNICDTGVDVVATRDMDLIK